MFQHKKSGYRWIPSFRPPPVFRAPPPIPRGPPPPPPPPPMYQAGADVVAFALDPEYHEIDSDYEYQPDGNNYEGYYD